MPLDFPSNPVQGQLYSNFYYDANTGVWRALNSLYAPNFLKDATFSSSTTARVPLTVQGLASQSANLQEWKDSTGTVLANISSTGAITSTTSSYLKDIHINRDDSTYEGGQINFRRASDNTDYWSIDAYGNTSTPSLRFFNGTPVVAMTLDSSGKILMPYQPAFFVSRSTSTTVNNVILFDQIKTNIGSCYNASTGKFTAPIAGTYYFGFGTIGSTSGTTRVQARINNALVFGAFQCRTENGTNFANGQITFIFTLAAGDYVTMYVSENTAFDDATGYTHWTGHLIG